MNFVFKEQGVLKHIKASNGSFTASGTGFLYNYTNKNKTLDIRAHRSDKLLYQLKFDRALTERADVFVDVFEKTSQINALMLSNNKTANLANTISGQRLAPIIKSTSVLSRYAFDLQIYDFNRFSKAFEAQYNFKNVKVKQFHPGQDTSEFFIARIKTMHNNVISVRGCCLSTLTGALSQKTSHDLISMEYGIHHDECVQRMLKASSKLSLLSLILDDNFWPEMFVRSESDDTKQREDSI